MINSTKEQIIENLIMPLEAVFGEFKKGAIVYLLDYCQKYKPENLKKVASEVINTSERFPYPASIIKHFDKIKLNVHVI